MSTNMDDIPRTNYTALLEGVFFVANEPLKTAKLAGMLDIPQELLEEEIHKLAREYSEDITRGIELECVASGWQLVTKSELHDDIAVFISQLDMRKLSGAARETLAIVAYAGPLTRHEINTLRGVASDSSVNSLEDKKLISVVGVQDSPGKPSLYAVTRQFLDSFGLTSTAQLPNLMDFAPSEEVRRRIEEKLGYLRADDALDDLRDTESLTEEDHTSSEDELIQSGLYNSESLNEVIAASFGLSEKIDLATLRLDEASEERVYESEALGE